MTQRPTSGELISMRLATHTPDYWLDRKKLWAEIDALTKERDDAIKAVEAWSDDSDRWNKAELVLHDRHEKLYGFLYRMLSRFPHRMNCLRGMNGKVYLDCNCDPEMQKISRLLTADAEAAR